MTRRNILSLLLLTSSFFICCNRIPSEYREFVGLPLEKQHDVMKGLPIDRQIDYYLAGMNYEAPPAIGLADDIARQGKAAIPFLIQRVRAESNESNQADIIYIFEVMHGSYYNLKNESEVITLINDIKAKARSRELQERCEEALKFIQENKLPDVEKALERAVRG